MADDYLDPQKCVGTALYLELQIDHPDGKAAFAQMIFTPQASMPGGAIVPATLYFRQLSAMRKRTMWKSTYARAIGVGEEMADANNAFEVAQTAMSGAASGEYGYVLKKLANWGYTLKRAPIYVEVSEEDLGVLKPRKTPYKIIGRIERCRTQLGWPDEVVDSAVKAGV